MTTRKLLADIIAFLVVMFVILFVVPLLLNAPSALLNLAGVAVLIVMVLGGVGIAHEKYLNKKNKEQ